MSNIKSTLNELLSIRDYPTQLIHAAEAMIVQNNFEISVVTAQMACEISVERTLNIFFLNKELQYLKDSIEDLLPSFNIANDKVRKLYTAITGDKIQNEFFGMNIKRWYL